MASKSKFPSALPILLAIALSALGWWFGSQFHPLWWAAWLAPLPILWLATRVRAPWAALAAFAAVAIGDIPRWNFGRAYLLMPVMPTLFMILAPAVIFAVAVMLYRRLAMRGQHVAAMFAVPVVIVALYYIHAATSLDGAAGDIGYTQMNALAVIQIAALTGVAGVGFLVMLGPACVATLCNASAPRSARLRTGLVGGGLIVLALAFGAWRLHAVPADSGTPVRIGLVSLDNADPLLSPTSAKGEKLMQRYVEAISNMAAHGARYVMIPEDAWVVSQADVPELRALAAREGVTVITGVDYKPQDKPERNMLLAFHPHGGAPSIYMKHHLVPGLERRYTPWKGYTMLSHSPGIGLAICKDMDFPAMGRAYAARDAQLLLVPAWDFTLDDWQHSRQAIMRGVESGFAIARVARNGRLTLTDDRGRVLDEANSARDDAQLMDTLWLRHTHTLYARWGDWFAWLDLIALVWLMVLAWGRSRGADPVVRPQHV